MNAFSIGDMPLAGPPWLYLILLFAIFWLHLMSMWFLIGTLITGIAALTTNKSGDWKTSEALRFLPIIMALVINLGVPPLLFLQVLYAPFFFSSSILIAVPWMSVFFLLLLGYGTIYAARYGAQKPWQAIALLGISTIAVITISFIYSNNMTLMIKPELWQKMYSYKQSGLHLYPNHLEVASRWIWVISPCLMAGAFLIKQPIRIWAIASAILSIGGLIAYKSFWTPEIAAYPVVKVALVADFALAGLLAVIAFLPTKDGLLEKILLGSWIALKGASVVALRHGIRSALLDPIYQLDKLPITLQPIAIALFLLVTVIGAGTVIWLYTNGRKGLTV